MAEVTHFRYTHTANVTGTSPGHYYESDQRYATGRYVRESDYAAVVKEGRDAIDLLNEMLEKSKSDYNALLERHKRLVEVLRYYSQRGDGGGKALAALAEEVSNENI